MKQTMMLIILLFALSMIILGSCLARIDLGDFYKRMAIIIQSSIIKLIVIPLLFLLIVIRLDIFSLWGFFIILEAAMPSAVSLPIVAKMRGGDTNLVSQGVFFSHLLSIFTIPLWIELFIRVSKFNLWS